MQETISVEPSVLQSSQKPRFLKFLPFIISLLLVALISSAITYLVLKRNEGSKNKIENVAVTAPSPVIIQTPTNISPEPTASTIEWRQYKSKSTSVSFRYPSTWTILDDTDAENNPGIGNEHISILSPNKKIRINWGYGFGGMGTSCDSNKPFGSGGSDSNQSCPKNRILTQNSAPLINGAFIVRGITTYNGTQYEPWLAIFDSATINLLSSYTDIPSPWHLFSGDSLNQIIFSTVATTLSDNTQSLGVYWHPSGPKMSEEEAIAYFDSPEMKEAELILETLSK